MLKVDLGEMEGIERPSRRRNLPVVLSRAEVRAVVINIRGTNRLVAFLLYGSGLRLSEALRLRVTDLDFEYGQVFVRNGKGGKDRRSTPPARLHEDLRRHLRKVKLVHEEDSAQGYGRVYLPNALARKYPHAAEQWTWQYAFPSTRRSIDPRTGVERRHHRSASAVQRAVKRAVERTRIMRRVT